MTDRNEYTADELLRIEALEWPDLDSVDLSQGTFTKNLQEAAILARDFARKLVTTPLPDEIVFVVLYGCSYDKNPLVEDEKTFPEDYEHDPPTATSVEFVTRLLWRDGFVPEWINVAVSHEDGQLTYITLTCCGRYSALPKMMYHITEGRPPFHILGPPMPPGFDHRSGEKYDLYWRKDAW